MPYVLRRLVYRYYDIDIICEEGSVVLFIIVKLESCSWANYFKNAAILVCLVGCLLLFSLIYYHRRPAVTGTIYPFDYIDAPLPVVRHHLYVIPPYHIIWEYAL